MKRQNMEQWDKLDKDSREVLEQYGYIRGSLLPGCPGEIIGNEQSGYWQATSTAWVRIKVTSLF